MQAIVQESDQLPTVKESKPLSMLLSVSRRLLMDSEFHTPTESGSTKRTTMLWWCSFSHKWKQGDPWPIKLEPDETCDEEAPDGQ